MHTHSRGLQFRQKIQTYNFETTLRRATVPMLSTGTERETVSVVDSPIAVRHQVSLYNQQRLISPGPADFAEGGEWLSTNGHRS